MTIEAIKILLLTLSISTFSISTAYSNNSSEYSIQTASSTNDSVTPVKCAEYICDHLSDFETYYNEANPDLERLTATSVENLIPLYIENIGNQIDGILIDLNNDYGYITVGYDYEIFDVQAKGEQPFFECSKTKFFFSTATGYSYYNDKIDDWVSVNKENISDEKDWENVTLNHGQYKGQEKDASGNGKIVNPMLYVHDKYGDDYFDYNSSSFDMDAYLQTDLSAYFTTENDGQQYSEGNCWIVSAFHILQYMAKSKFSNMYFNDYVDYDAKQNEPNIYSKHFNSKDESLEKVKTNSGIVDKWELNINNNGFPRLYSIIREYIDGVYKKCDDGYIWETRDIVKYICNKFGYTVDISTHYNWNYYADYLVNEILEERPALWFTLTGTYGSHAMAVCGYRYYRRQRKFWHFTYTTYKLFYELRDGHSLERRWFDASGHDLSLGCLVFFKY